MHWLTSRQPWTLHHGTASVTLLKAFIIAFHLSGGSDDVLPEPPSFLLSRFPLCRTTPSLVSTRGAGYQEGGGRDREDITSLSRTTLRYHARTPSRVLLEISEWGHDTFMNHVARVASVLIGSEMSTAAIARHGPPLPAPMTPPQPIGSSTARYDTPQQRIHITSTQAINTAIVADYSVWLPLSATGPSTHLHSLCTLCWEDVSVELLGDFVIGNDPKVQRHVEALSSYFV